MKKLIIVLMMVAMASFLFVGCLSGTTTPATTTTTTTTTVTPTLTVAPVITLVPGVSLTSTSTQYVNKAGAAAGIVITGTAPTYAEVKLYIGSIVAGTADVGAGGVWTLTISKSELGTDGAKTLYAVAEEPGLAVSAKSNEVKFTLDATVPTMASVVARVAADYYEVTFSEAIGAAADYVATATSALNFDNWTVAGFLLVAGDSIVPMSVKVIRITDASDAVALAGTAYNIKCWDIVDLAGNPIATAAIPAVIYGETLP